MKNALERYNYWLSNLSGNPAALAELRAIAGDDSTIMELFHADLAFGTAGLRGLMGMGSCRMNVYTVRHATQGLCDYLLAADPKPSVAIAYDSRLLSDTFAREAACVFAANGIKVHLYSELMPTPALSYAVRELRCNAGVVVTASHNPAQYNGYKAYDHTGCQLSPNAAGEVMRRMQATDLFAGPKLTDFDSALGSGLINWIPEAFVQQYIDRVLAESLQPDILTKANLKLAYTPLNGAGNRCVLTVLAKAGVADIAVVPEQEHPDGNFPTCPYPNPESRSALKLGLALARNTMADLLLATDPDCDRIAVAVPNGADYTVLTGNEAGVLLLDYIARTRSAQGRLPERPVAVKSIVTTKLADLVAAEYGVEMISVLTGFKFIGGVIWELEQTGRADRFLFGFEESCGYLSGAYVRDKDAVNAALLLAEAAADCKLRGKTLLNQLADIYARHGIFTDFVESYEFAGVQGMREMESIMASLRKNPPTEIAGEPITIFTDYQVSERAENGVVSPVALPRSNVLEYGLQNGCSVIIRPSGTEPKIKIYYSLAGESNAEVTGLADRYKAACRRIIGRE